MGVAQAGDRDLVRVELDPASEGIRPRLEIDRGARERDPSVGDPDRLDPAEALVAGQRRDPAAADEHIERHQAVPVAVMAVAGPQNRSGSWIGNGSASSARSWSWSSPAPIPSASAIRAFGPVRWPA